MQGIDHCKSGGVIASHCVPFFALWRRARVVMAPKKKAGAAEPVNLPLPKSTAGDEYLVEYSKALDTIKAHKVFKDVGQEMPVGLDSKVFDPDECRKALAKGGPGEYVAVGNIFWLDLMYCTMRGVPANVPNIKLMTEHQFKEPKTFNDPLEVALTAANQSVMDSRGTLQSVTPEEKIHAFVWAIHRDIEAQRPDSVIKLWLNAARSTMLRFRVIDTEDFSCHCLQKKLMVNGF